jgi:two-component system cell cycle sensor histidine kinase/response regulator CckA
MPAETILLVDDEDLLRELTREVLVGLGYEVLDAPSGRAALEAAVLHRGPVHLLITDLLLPGMNGQDLWQTFAQLHPETRVLFISGYGDVAIVKRGIISPGTPILSKPFHMAALAEKVREVLDASVD